MDNIVGFTGSRKGMTDAQQVTVTRLLNELKVDVVHHGDCIGADALFHDIAHARWANITAHPPEADGHRAFCKAHTTEPALPYLERNAAIVAASDILIATPDSAKEKLRSGTWATIRLARKERLKVYVVVPDGTVLGDTQVTTATPVQAR